MLKVNRLARKGAITPLFAILLPVIFLLCGFAINLAYMQLTSAQLKIATDASAHAGGRAMSIKNKQPPPWRSLNKLPMQTRLAGAPCL